MASSALNPLHEPPEEDASDVRSGRMNLPHQLRDKVDIVRGNVLPVVVSNFDIVNFRVLLKCPYQKGLVYAALGGGLVDEKQVHPRIVHFVAVSVVCTSMWRVPCDAHFEPSNANVVDEALHHPLQS